VHRGLQTEKNLKTAYKSYDVVGDTAIIRVSESLEQQCGKIAEDIMETHKNVQSVWRQHSPVSGDFRLRTLKWVKGEKRTETIHKEFGCTFKVDIAHCYFSPRLSYERQRIAQQVQIGEVIVNMFAGVGCYSIIIAKHSKADKIHSIDLNPIAIKYMQENIKLNKVEGKVFAIQGDAKEVIKEKMQGTANRVVMPLPQLAYNYLDYAISALKPNGGWIHYYDFEHAKKEENPKEKVKAKISEKLQKLCIDFEVPYSRVVRTTGPNWYQIVIDILVRK